MSIFWQFFHNQTKLFDQNIKNNKNKSIHLPNNKKQTKEKMFTVNRKLKLIYL